MSIKDHPKAGVNFYDITNILKDKELLLLVINQLSWCFRKPIDIVVGIESRGFILASAVANQIGAGFVPLRKAGKLPRDVFSIGYDLEYGKETLELHRDAIQPEQNVLIIDDVLATGGTAEAAVKLVSLTGAGSINLAFLIEIESLLGRKKLHGYKYESIIKV